MASMNAPMPAMILHDTLLVGGIPGRAKFRERAAS
jgi:hypothetical protein